MTCDIEKTIQIFNERKKKKKLQPSKCDSFLLKPCGKCLQHFQLSTSLFFMM